MAKLTLKWRVAKKFFNKILMTDSYDTCWEWQGRKNSDGYGLFYSGKYKLAHRVAWTLYHLRKVPKGKEVCHKCDNPGCVNPKHLFAATHAENMKDMVNKGRSSRLAGSSNPNSRLTEAKVKRIKEMLASGIPIKATSALFDVSKAQIYRIANGLHWANV